MTTLCTQPFAESVNQKWPRIHIPKTQVPDKREAPVRIVLPYKDQKSANVVRKQLADLSRKINADIGPVYTSRKIKVREDKPPLVSQQCVVYSFQCGLCDAGYVDYTCRHIHQRIEEHKGSAIGNHLREQHDMEPEDIVESFRILRKCQNKFDCLLFELFFCFIKELKPTLTNSEIQFAPYYLFRSIPVKIIVIFCCFYFIFLAPFHLFHHILAFATFLSIIICL